jgi:cysteine-rich repeat protein
MRALAIVSCAGFAALLAACYAPTYEGLVCAATEPQCPDGYACVSNMCRETTGGCGDGARDEGEACDDGNTTNETLCPYGMATCTLCNADCTAALPLVGRYCGDRLVETGVEACDDGNSAACGSCNADCTANLSPAAATGMLMGVGGLTSANDGQNIGVFDGVIPNYQGFEIDTNGSVTAGFTRVDIAGTNPVTALVSAMNASALAVNASDAGNGNVRLVNQFLTGRGNGPIMTTIPAPFMAMGMSGGATGDCPRGTGCTNNGVCGSNSCVNSVCD